MKIKTDFVTNSSSTSFVIANLSGNNNSVIELYNDDGIQINIDLSKYCSVISSIEDFEVVDADFIEFISKEHKSVLKKIKKVFSKNGVIYFLNVNTWTDCSEADEYFRNSIDSFLFDQGVLHLIKANKNLIQLW